MLCMLNGEEIEVPEGLIENETIFMDVVNLETFNRLTNEEKDLLKKYLPGTEHGEDNQETIRTIFDGSEKFKHSNPVRTSYQRIKNGLLSSKLVQANKKGRLLKYRKHQLNQESYYKNLLKEVIVSRQFLLDKSYKHGLSEFASKNKNRNPFKHRYTSLNPCMDKANRRLQKILRDISTECKDGDISSEDEFVSENHMSKTNLKDLISGTSEKQYPASSNRIIDTLSDLDIKSMSIYHELRRIASEIHPELDIGGISIADVVMRCNSFKRSAKKKMKKSMKKSAVFSPPPKEANKDKSFPPSPEKEKRHHATTKDIEHVGFPKKSSFFSLIGYFFDQKEERKCTKRKIEEKVGEWQSHNSSELSPWKILYSDWRPLVHYAIEYMSGKGTSSLLHDFIPLLTLLEEDEFQWAGPDHTNDAVILPLFHHWLDTLTKVMVKSETNLHGEDKHRKTIDPTRTSYIVRETTLGEKETFRKQEKERYDQPHNAYIYQTHGYQSIVGPVKGVFSSRDVSTSKAREHAMLVSDRPPYVTILCIVRDAVARLPNGEGTRADVCVLLRDSQYLNSGATPQQVHNVVSGALDRLHAEKDACVKFDPVRKVWLYLHRDRSIEEFEKLHHASGAAALAKRQMNLFKQKAAKQKKVIEEMKETIEEVQRKESMSCKSKITPNQTNTSKTEKTVSRKDEKQQDNVNDSSLKKKAPKRKRPMPETGTSKVPKEKDEAKPARPPSNDFNLPFDNEALMATQSILGDDDPSRIFDDPPPDVDFLNIDVFSGPSSVLPNLSLDSSIGNSFSTDMLNELSVADIDTNLFSGDRLSPVESRDQGISKADSTVLRSDIKSTSSLTKTPTANNIQNVLTTKNTFQQTKQLPHILSEKAVTMLKPCSDTLKNSKTPNISDSKNLLIQPNSQENIIQKTCVADNSVVISQKEQSLPATKKSEIGNAVKSLKLKMPSTSSNISSSSNKSIHLKSSINQLKSMQLSQSSVSKTKENISKIPLHPYLNNIAGDQSTSKKMNIAAGQSISVRVHPSGMILSSQNKKKQYQISQTKATSQKNAGTSLQTLSQFIISNNSQVVAPRIANTTNKTTLQQQLSNLNIPRGNTSGSPIARFIGQGAKAVRIETTPLVDNLKAGDVKLTRSTSLPLGYQVVNVKENVTRKIDTISSIANPMHGNNAPSQRQSFSQIKPSTKMVAKISSPNAIQSNSSAQRSFMSTQVPNKNISDNSVKTSAQAQGVTSIQALLQVAQQGIRVTEQSSITKAMKNKPRYVAVSRKLIPQIQTHIDIKKTKSFPLSKQCNQVPILTSSVGINQVDKVPSTSLLSTQSVKNIVAPLRISLPRTSIGGNNVPNSTNNLTQQNNRLTAQNMGFSSPLNSPAQTSLNITNVNQNNLNNFEKQN